MAQTLRATGLAARSLRLAYEGFGLLFPLAFVPALALSALTGGSGPAEPGRVGVALLLTIAANLIVSFLVTGVMCLAALDIALGKRHSLSEYLSQTLRHLGAIIVLGLLLSVATGLALALLVIPGIYVAARFLPWAAAIVFENAGWSGLGRAQELTEGHRWPLVGAILLMGLAGLLVVAVALPLVAMAQGSFALSVLVDAAVSALYYAAASAFTAVVYLELRGIKEGASVAEIAATID